MERTCLLINMSITIILVNAERAAQLENAWHRGLNNDVFYDFVSTLIDR